ncbi:MAG: hypothetical protein H7Y13_06450 [Sphingobacteriaceae bacterium]|nr:hypothetical protein [Sphingobacteriaceae bacterium]
MSISRFLLVFLFNTFFTSLIAQQKPEKLTVFFEKVYLHTDRELYVGGEDIWYKAYLVNARGNAPLATSSNLYVELISPRSTIINRQVVRFTKSMAKGDFKLKDSLPAGEYKLRAYTNWMRNFGENFIFEKIIKVTDASTATTPSRTRVTSATTITSNVGASGSPAAPIVRFFPEGGSLVEGISSRVAFKIESADGRGMASKGSIVSSSGESVASFTSDATGLGSFSLKPASGTKYTAEGTIAPNRTFKAVLPQALLSGFGMYVQEKDSIINVMTFLNEPSLAESQNKKLYLIVRQGGKTIISTEIAVTGPQVVTRLSKAVLPTGINAFTLYDVKGRPQCERLVFIHQPGRVNVSITADKSEYKSKEKVNLLIKATDGNGVPLKTNLSLAVTDAGVVPSNEMDIRTYLLLQSEIKGKIENPKQYFDESNADRRKQLDLLLLTQGWRDFVWKRVADSTLRIKYVLEQGITISGAVKDGIKNKPLAGANITLRTPQSKDQKFFSARTDSLGRYFIDNIQFTGRFPVIVTTRNDKGEPYGKVSLDSVFSDIMAIKKPSQLLPVLDFSKESTLLSERLIKRRRVSLSDTVELAAVTIKAKKKTVTLMSGSQMFDFGYPEENFVINEKDHKEYKSLLHYLLTKSNYSTVSSGSSSNRLLFYGEKGRAIRPVILLNGKEIGVLESEATSIAEPSTESTTDGAADGSENAVAGAQDIDDDFAFYTMDMIEKINIQKLMQTDPNGRRPPEIGYLVTITTKPDALIWKQRDKVVATINGYYQSRVFYSPNYNQPDTKPDIRPTIFWNPSLITNEKGEASVSYFNADAKNKIRIVAEGISEKGIPLVGNTEYIVK